MIIKQPEDKILDKERISAILIHLNHLSNDMNSMAHIHDIIRATNRIPGLKGTFSYQREEGVIFTTET